MKNKGLSNKDGEILSLEEKKLRNLIGDLKRVDAPKDFDFRLKARIANAKLSDFQPRFLPVFRYVLPLSIILVIFAFVVVNGLYFPDNLTVSQITEDVPQIKSEQINPPRIPSVTAPIVDFDTVSKDEETVAEKPPAKLETAKIEQDIKLSANKPQFIAVKSPTTVPKKNQIVKEVKNDNGGGSRDIASSSPKNILPTGININSTPENLTNDEIKQPLNNQEILSQIGIEAIFTDVGWMVRSIKKDSLAERIGMKAGDLVEAINGKKLTDKLVDSEAIEVKTLTILRGGKMIEITPQINK